MKSENDIKFCSLFADKISTLRAGGKLLKVCFPSSMADLFMISDYIKENGCDYIITGKLSNILVLDGGYDGVVINTKNLKGIDIEENLICAGSGEKLAKVVNMAAERGLSGLEKLCGIPGTVGGAVCMNSGCFGADMSMAVEKVYLLI